MRKKTIIYIAILAIMLGLTSIILVMNTKTSTIKGALSDFAVRDTGTITMVYISDMNFNSVKLERKEPGNWTVNEIYEVNYDNIRTLFKTLIWVEVREPVPNRHMNEVTALLSATGSKVEIYQERYRINLFDKIKLFPFIKRTKTFYVGEATSDQTGTYMLMEGSSMPYVTYMPGFRGFLSTRFSPREKDWRNPVIFNYRLGDIKSIQLEFNEFPEHSFKMINKGDRSFEIKSLQNPETPIENYNEINVLNFFSSFDNVNFEAIINHLSIKDSILASTPMHVFTLELLDGETSTVKTYKKWAIDGAVSFDDIETPYDRDRLYALINNGNDFVLIQYYVFDRITKPLYYFLE